MHRYLITGPNFDTIECDAADLDEYLVECALEGHDGLLIDTERRTFTDLATVAAEAARDAADQAAHIRHESMMEIFV